MTAAPSGQSKAAAPNDPFVEDVAPAEDAKPTKTEAKASAKKAEPKAKPAAPKDEREVTHSDPAPVAEEQNDDKKCGGEHCMCEGYNRKGDPLKQMGNFEKLPLSVSVGQVNISVELYSGQPVMKLSLVGWVGEESLAILASDASDIEDALSQIRKTLSA